MRGSGLFVLAIGYNSEHVRASIGMTELTLHVPFDVGVTAVLE